MDKTKTKKLKGPNIIEIIDETILTKVKALVTKYEIWSEEEESNLTEQVPFDGIEPAVWDGCDSWPIYDLGLDALKIMGSNRVIIADKHLLVMTDDDACIGWGLDQLTELIPELQHIN